jgi:hypothetical protein
VVPNTSTRFTGEPYRSSLDDSNAPMSAIEEIAKGKGRVAQTRREVSKPRRCQIGKPNGKQAGAGAGRSYEGETRTIAGSVRHLERQKGWGETFMAQGAALGRR